jgi:hypothetical protein
MHSILTTLCNDSNNMCADNGLVWQTIQKFSILFSHFPKIINIKIIFYYYSNKKIYYNTIFFLLFYTHSFYFISHLSLLTNSKILFHYSVMFCHLPNKANVLTCLLPTVTLAPHWLIFLLNLLTNPSVDFNYFVDVEHLVIDYSKRIIILSTYHEYFLAHKSKLSP